MMFSFALGANKRDFFCLKNALDLLCRGKRMVINVDKSCIIFRGLSEAFIKMVRDKFPFPLKSLDEGFKYLGFFLKPNKYCMIDWMWMV